ncbi:hypothetical protein [Anaeromicropila herbilytica]|uniref:RanBP2-type domain-containing protein n=1 Tax=Anaeromicropila herbilytica TaxID=2785025 RepID=A0A7R7IDC0_9FIRM|nr:hypothetical protein [Anaeromicropila herbilytica]BCN30889.1 hypothetical protein bsdtb5_21840 [Anaeromicropila herbilytica]
MEDKIIEGYWDCDYCEKKAIKGHLRECPACGKARGENTEFYLLDRTYLDDEAAEKVSMNPDWLCSFCEQLNSDFDENCTSCGASKQESEENYFEMRERKDAKEAERKDEYDDFESNYAYNSQGSSSGKWKRIGIFVVLFLAICSAFGIYKAMQPKVVKVTGFEWNKTLDIEKYQTVSESDWSLPDKARLTDTKREIYRYKHVIDHYKTVTKEVPHQVASGYHYETSTRNLGNGHFKETRRKVTDYKTVYKTETYKKAVYVDVPVFKKKYYYDIDRWKNNRKVKSSGKNQKDYIGKYTLAKATSDSGIGKEREGEIEEHYYIKTVNKKKQKKKYEVSEKDWRSIKKNKTIKIKVDLDGYATVVKKDKK